VSVSAADNVHRCTQRGHKTRGDRGGNAAHIG
jgi:hypothetical protein